MKRLILALAASATFCATAFGDSVPVPTPKPYVLGETLQDDLDARRDRISRLTVEQALADFRSVSITERLEGRDHSAASQAACSLYYDAASVLIKAGRIKADDIRTNAEVKAAVDEALRRSEPTEYYALTADMVRNLIYMGATLAVYQQGGSCFTKNTANLTIDKSARDNQFRDLRSGAGDFLKEEVEGEMKTIDLRPSGTPSPKPDLGLEHEAGRVDLEDDLDAGYSQHDNSFGPCTTGQENGTKRKLTTEERRLVCDKYIDALTTLIDRGEVLHLASNNLYLINDEDARNLMIVGAVAYIVNENTDHPCTTGMGKDGKQLSQPELSQTCSATRAAWTVIHAEKLEAMVK